MPLIAVVIRQLQHLRPVTSAVIEESTDPDIDSQVHYLKHAAAEHVQQFKAQFLEFSKADWYVDILDKDTGRAAETYQLNK